MLSDNIKNYRKKNNMSQDELAEKLGVSRQSISLWETGQTQPTIDNIIALSKVFNISSDMLLGSSENIDISQKKSPAGKAPNKKKKNRADNSVDCYGCFSGCCYRSSNTGCGF